MPDIQAIPVRSRGLPSGVRGNGIPTVILRWVPPVLNFARFLSFIMVPPIYSLTRVQLTSNTCDRGYWGEGDPGGQAQLKITKTFGLLWLSVALPLQQACPWISKDASR